jgi:deazaflavin-dependent oxidoreductase (nitroreductase family)
MTYLKPPALTRHVVNPIVMRFHPGGVATLTVVGRRSGVSRKVPVIPVEIDGVRYLVAPYGESQWVRNLRASGGGELTNRGQRQIVQAREVPVDQRGPIITAYRRLVSRTVRSCFTTLPDAKDHPVFRLS